MLSKNVIFDTNNHKYQQLQLQIPNTKYQIPNSQKLIPLVRICPVTFGSGIGAELKE
jgi:hypothetical protein